MIQADTARIRRDLAQLARPPVRERVSEAAEKYVRIGHASAATAWSASTAPYIIKPMDTLEARIYTTVCFVGPARTGKTMGLTDCWIASKVKNNPGDMMIVHSSQDQARDYSKRRVDRLLRNSPDLKDEIASDSHADNTYDKQFRNGMLLTIGWPTISQLSGKDIEAIALPDYDRGVEDIGGEGTKYYLAQKRTETFLSAGMTMVESSPGYAWIDPLWKRQTPHELPAAYGITRIYNEGTRERYYWQCWDCQEWFIPDYTMLQWEDHADVLKASKTVVLECPHCHQHAKQEQKRALNLNGVWLAEGLEIDKAGNIGGTARESKIASFHVDGTVAAYQTWSGLVYKLIAAERVVDETDDEKDIKTVTLLDIGIPYKPRKIGKPKDAQAIRDRAEVWDKFTVPQGVRTLITTVDVQKSSFVVQVTGYGKDKERWLIDYFKIGQTQEPKSKKYRTLDPARYAWHWDELEKLATKNYALGDGSGRRMASQIVMIDTGGADGVTSNSYAFWRRMVAKGKRHFVLIKGNSLMSAPRIKKTYPDTTGNSQKKAIAAGDVPVLLINVNLFKDELDADLKNEDMGPGYFHTARWTKAEWYAGLGREHKDEKTGRWSEAKGNESWDLSVYADAGFVYLKLDRMNWETPYAYAAQWQDNRNVFDEKKPGEKPKQAPAKPKAKRIAKAPVKPGGAGTWL